LTEAARLETGEPGPAAAEPSRSYSRFRWVVLGLTTCLQLGMSVPQQTPAAIGPVLTRELGLSGAELGLLTSAIWGGMLLGMLPSGILVDRFGERRVIAFGGGALTLLVLAASFAPSFPVLFGILLLAAIGASAGSPGGTKALAAWFPVWQRGTAMGIRQTGVTVAGVLAAVILPPVAVRFHWDAAFRVAAALVLASCLIFTLFYREPGGTRPPFSLDLRALAWNRTFVFATIYSWMFMGALGCSVTYFGVSLNQEAGLPAVQAGLALAVLQVGGIAGRLGWGFAADRAGRVGPALVLSAALSVAACAAMARVQGHVAVPLLVGLAFLLGLATMGWNALYMTVVSGVVPVEKAATAIGAGLTVSFTGMFGIPPVFGLIADARGGYPAAWAALAVWAALGTLVATQVRDRRGTSR
jgi:sugar phosphate permease